MGNMKGVRRKVLYEQSVRKSARELRTYKLFLLFTGFVGANCLVDSIRLPSNGETKAKIQRLVQMRDAAANADMELTPLKVKINHCLEKSYPAVSATCISNYWSQRYTAVISAQRRKEAINAQIREVREEGARRAPLIAAAIGTILAFFSILATYIFELRFFNNAKREVGKEQIAGVRGQTTEGGQA